MASTGPEAIRYLGQTSEEAAADHAADFISLSAEGGAGYDEAEEADEEEEDDYMTMGLPTESIASARTVESSLQRRQRLRREAEARARPKSKAELAAAEAAKREEALSTSLDKSNKGFKMMAKLGFKAGGALGKEGGDGRKEPIGIDMRAGRGGIGLDEERKRKVREEVDESVKRKKVEEGEYWERLKSEREEKEREGKIWSAMKVCERLDEGDFSDASAEKPSVAEQDSAPHEDGQKGTKKPRGKSKPLQSIPVIWRALARSRLEKERNQKMRHALQQSLSRLPTYDDLEEDKQDKQAFGTEEEELEEEDPELEALLALASEERLAKVVSYLRERHHYCFWCKYEYPDESMEGCPGPTEEDHD